MNEDQGRKIEQQKDFVVRKGHILFILLLMIACWLGSGLLIAWISPPLEYRGIIGDMFGAVNALFSGLALCGIILSIYLQNRELRAQQDEFKKQNFENTFFKLIELIRENRGEVRVDEEIIKRKLSASEKSEKSHYKTLQGTIAIDSIYRNYRKNLRGLGLPKNEDDLISNIKECYFKESNRLHAYHNTIRKTMFYLLGSNLKDKIIYEDIFSSQFTLSEKLLFLDSELINDDKLLKIVIFSQRFVDDILNEKYFLTKDHFNLYKRTFK